MKNSIREKLQAILTASQRELRQAADDNQAYHILVVDDEADHCLLIERFVTSYGYDCASAESGQRALDHLEQHSVDLLITDMMMPGIDGMALLLEVKKRWPNTKVLVLTGHSEDYSFKDVILAGAADFMEKPVSKDMLEARIERIFYESMLLAETVNELKNKDILLDLLRLSNSHHELPQLLHEFLLCLTSFPWMELERKGAILLVDENDPQTLVMAAQHDLAPPLREICARVPFGRCLCGLAAERRQTVFAGHLDHAHTNLFPGMEDHGHYCVPILLADNTLLGVFTLYVKPGAKRRQAVELTLQAAAQTVAGIIVNKRNEAKVLDNERRIRAITDSTLDAIIMMNTQGDISFWNPAAERIFGYPAQEVLGKNLHGLLAPPNYQDGYAAGLHAYLASGSGHFVGKTIELSAQGKDGRVIPIELSLSSLKLKEEWHAVATVRDITMRKRLEDEKERLNVQLRQAQKMEAIGTLAGGIAHDFNNILGAIIGFADIAQDEVPKDSLAHEDLERILVAGERAKNLVSQILSFSRQKEEELVPIKIQFILKEVIKLLRATIPANIQISQDIDPNTDFILADPTEIHQLIMNLCTNAYYAMREAGGRLSIQLGNFTIAPGQEARDLALREGRYIRLSVLDTGVGMSPRVMEHIFEPYYTTKPQGEGTGLGLSLVHGIVNGYGGEVQVRSTVGQGTSFHIYLPAFFGPAPALADAVQTIPNGNKERILLVDDETALVEAISRQLRKLDYEVTTRTSSVEALELFRCRPDSFDLVVTDLAMPNMTGLNLVSAMATIRPGLPAILTTGFVDSTTPEAAAQAGIKHIVNKPINLYELALAIRQALSEATA